MPPDPKKFVANALSLFGTDTMLCDGLPCEPVWLNPEYTPAEAVELVRPGLDLPTPCILQQRGAQDHIMGYLKLTSVGVEAYEPRGFPVEVFQ